MYPEHGQNEEEAGDFGHMTVTIDPKNLPTTFLLSEARKSDVGEHPALLPGFLYVGASVLYSEPGLGKSMLSGQVEEFLAYGRPFGPWCPEEPVRCLVIDLEGDMRLAAERSLRITPFGLLDSDHDREISADVLYTTEWNAPRGEGLRDSFTDRVALLEQRLAGAAQAGRPFGYVRIDTMRLFIGSKPHGANAYEWDAFCVGELNRVARDHDIALVLVHHTNKSGELSGSMGVAGSAICVMQLKRNPDNDDECLLMSHKVRVDADFRYALAMDERGRWFFTEDITPTQAELGGTKRAIVDQLTKRENVVLADLRDALPGIALNTLKSALRRLSRDGIAIYRRGTWQLTQTTVASHPKCAVCSMPMEVYAAGQTTHPGCSQSPFMEQVVQKFLGTPVIPGQASPELAESGDFPAVGKSANEASSEEEPEEEEDFEHPEVAKWPAFAEMRASIERSRMKPIPRVPPVEREGKPWSYVAENLDAHFKARMWEGEIPEGTTNIILLDRNGSYMSAMSSVSVAPNKLTHSGALGADPLARKHLSGLFLVVIPEWDPAVRHNARIPHPLGRAIEGKEPGETAWITGPSMELLDKLAAEGRIKVADVVDSWTGRRNTSLFEGFYKWSVTVREATAQEDVKVRTEAKRAMSRAVRALHPRQAKSPWWRPDWHRSVKAEAAARHWRTADRAVEGGAALISIGAVDETVWAVPAEVEAPALWVPAPYRLGGGYGQVKHKELLVGGEKVASPVTVEQWQGRGRRGKR